LGAVNVLGSAYTTATGTKTVTATPSLNDLIFIVTAYSGGSGTTAPTDNNSDGKGTYDLVNSVGTLLFFWVRHALIGSGTSTVFTWAPGTTTGGGLVVLNVSGMSRYSTSAIRQSNVETLQLSGTTPTVALGEAVLTGNPVIGAVLNGTNPATMTPRSSPSYSEAADLGYNTPSTGLEVMYINSGETASSIAWGGTSPSAYRAAVAELDASALPTILRRRTLGQKVGSRQ